MPDKHLPPRPADPAGHGHHGSDNPPEGRWAHAHGDRWVVAVPDRDGRHRCSECDVYLVVPR